MSATELERLLYMSQAFEPHVYDGFRRVPLPRGARVADVGCGALGALPALAALVGDQGLAVGIDVSEPSLAQARAILDSRGIGNVHLVRANIDELEPLDICPPGPFDAVFCRLFLFHQPDPAATLRRMASIVRPGGYVVTHELLHAPRLPRSQPEVPEFDAVMDICAETMRRGGASPEAPRRMPSLCEQAGLTVVSQRGFLNVNVDAAGIRAYRDLLSGLRPRAIALGVVSEVEVESLLARLRTAEQQTYESIFGVIFVETIAQVP
jgi:SAM-dependent methyltransferase